MSYEPEHQFDLSLCHKADYTGSSGLKESEEYVNMQGKVVGFVGGGAHLLGVVSACVVVFLRGCAFVYCIGESEISCGITIRASRDRDWDCSSRDGQRSFDDDSLQV